jgi:RNA polymerase sigma-70 factor (ECF subfamily)
MKEKVTDIELIQSLNAGDAKAFDQLYFCYHKAVFANIIKLVKKQEEAEELLQDVFIALWQNRSKIDAQQSVAGWLAVVSYNKALNFLNKSIKAVLIANNVNPMEIADLPEIADPAFELQISLLNEAIEKLPLRKKQAFVLCKLEGKSYEEAAAILNISPNTIKEHIVLATKFIKSYAATKYSTSAISVIAFIASFS